MRVSLDPLDTDQWSLADPVADQTRDLSDTGPLRHFVVCGDNPLAYRLVVELRERYDAHVTAIVGPGQSEWAERIAGVAGTDVVITERVDASAFARAQLVEADALALVNQDDGGNVDAALVAQEIKPGIRIVIRMFNLSLGRRMEDMLTNCHVISPAAIAAPAFVAAALDETTSAPIRIADRTLVSRRRTSVEDKNIVLGLAVMGPRGTEPETLPVDDSRADLVLAEGKPAGPPRVRRRQSSYRVLPILFGRRVRLIATLFLIVLALGTVALARTMPVGDALYTAIIAELSGNTPPDVNLASKIALVVLTLVSIVLIPVLTAALVDATVQARLRREAGGLHGPIANHFVVVGLGDVGTGVLRSLYEQGHDVVAIEKDPEARGVRVARELGVPLIIGDGSRTANLAAASVATSQCLIISSTDDVINLETALKGRAEKPDLRVVLRLFDGEFADRVKKAFNINTSRSVSYLAAPAFAAAMLGRHVIATIPVRRRILLVAELPICADSPLEHQPVGAVNVDHESRLLGIRTGEGQVLWRVSEGRPLRRTDRLIVIATRTGLGRLMARTETPAEAEPQEPFRLLEPWRMPHSRSDQADPSSGENPTIGPRDAGLPGPA